MKFYMLRIVDLHSKHNLSLGHNTSQRVNAADTGIESLSIPMYNIMGTTYNRDLHL